MNIIIVGCGNETFETAEVLAENNSILLISHRRPAHLTELLEKEKNISFVLCDVTDLSAIRGILAPMYIGVDALISTVESSCLALPHDGFDGFRRDFELNFFGNLVPIKAALAEMIPAQAGIIIVLFSTSGLSACNGLSTSSSAKWALRNLCSSLRSEVRPYGISVDVLFNRTVKNQHSKNSIREDYINHELIAGKIARLLENPKNSNHFIPRQNYLLHPLERLLPSILNNTTGLKRRRTKKNFNVKPINSVLITGASSGLGKELAKLYSKTAETLYLVARNDKSLLEVKSDIMACSECAVHVANVDIGDSQAVADFADTIDHVDILINNAGSSVIGQVNDIPINVYNQNFATNFFGAVQLTLEFLKKERKPAKVVNVLSTTAIAGRREQSCYSATKAALWAFTRSLRRTIGDEVQIMEVLPSTFIHSNFSKNAVRITSEGNTRFGEISPKSHKAFAVRNLTSQKVAEQIYGAERRGKEIVLIPFKSRLFLILEACLPWLFHKMFK